MSKRNLISISVVDGGERREVFIRPAAVQLIEPTDNGTRSRVTVGKRVYTVAERPEDLTSRINRAS